MTQSRYPKVSEDRQREPGIVDGWIDFGLYRVRVRRWLFAGDGHWRDQAGNTYGRDGVRLVEDGTARELASLPDWTRQEGRERCAITRPYAGGARKPPPYVRRLNALRRAIAAGSGEYLWHSTLRVYAGPEGFRAAAALARSADPEDAAMPLVVLPAGDDPRAYDWSALALWRYSEADARDLSERPLFWCEERPVRVGDAYRVRLYDERAPIDEATRDLLAAILLHQGHYAFAVRGLPGEDGRPGRLVEYVREGAEPLERAA